jgi:hypothetical protein
MTLGTCVEETTDRLPLSIIFDRVAKPHETPKALNTVVEQPTTHDPSVTLDETRPFNPIEASPLPGNTVAILPTNPTPSMIAGTPNNGGVPNTGVGGPGQYGVHFFQVAATGHSVVYVIDRSLSMGMNRAFNRASVELVTSLQHLSPDVQFQVVAYNHQEPHCLVGSDRLLPAQPEIVASFVQAFDALLPSGSTNHVAALQRALSLSPDAIYLVTDADDLTVKDVQKVSNWNRARTAIHVIEMVSRRTPQPDGPLMQLASNNHGTYRCVSPIQ